MIVIGLDGATWDVIRPNLASLPAISSMLERYRHSTLECDVRPVHSSASWTTIFSGLRPEEHGITEFVMGEKARGELLARRMFVWDRVKRAIVMGVPISLPPVNVNYELRGWEAAVLSTTKEEMFESTKRMLADARGAIEHGAADLVVSVFSETDRAQHVFWHDKAGLLEHYRSVDRALGELAPLLEGRDFLILSDHGFTDAEETRKNNWDTVRPGQTGGHHPSGIAISNRRPPEKVGGVCGFMESCLGV